MSALLDTRRTSDRYRPKVYKKKCSFIYLNPGFYHKLSEFPFIGPVTILTVVACLYINYNAGICVGVIFLHMFIIIVMEKVTKIVGDDFLRIKIPSHGKYSFLIFPKRNSLF